MYLYELYKAMGKGLRQHNVPEQAIRESCLTVLGIVLLVVSFINALFGVIVSLIFSFLVTGHATVLPVAVVMIVCLNLAIQFGPSRFKNNPEAEKNFIEKIETAIS